MLNNAEHNQVKVNIIAAHQTGDDNRRSGGRSPNGFHAMRNKRCEDADKIRAFIPYTVSNDRTDKRTIHMHIRSTDDNIRKTQKIGSAKSRQAIVTRTGTTTRRSTYLAPYTLISRISTNFVAFVWSKIETDRSHQSPLKVSHSSAVDDE
ncbi:hypothetical protein DINM_005070, partial [Dirofilaria immitis]|nr:hypothetical protein [Dirofilaria immitis]